MRARSSARVLTGCSIWLVTGACAADADPDGQGDSGGAWPPHDCVTTQSPFVQPDCLDALRVACNAHDAEDDCAAALPVSFDDGGYGVRCRWAEVVTFSDAAACTVLSVGARCEASVDGECGDFCSGDAMLSDVAAITSQLEIIRMCGGPLGPWSAVGSDDDFVATCGPNLEPPAPPLCDCADAACQAD